MGKYFELTKLTKNHILIFLLPLFYISVAYLKKVQMKIFHDNAFDYWSCDDAANDIDAKHCREIKKIEFYFNIFSPKILSIFPFLYIKFVLKKKVLASEQNEPKKYLAKIRKIIIAFIIIIISIFEYIDMKPTE